MEKHIDDRANFRAAGRSPEGFLLIEDDKMHVHPVAVVGAQPIVRLSDVEPVLSYENKPEFVINIPSKSIWTGAAIEIVHATPAGFGTLGDLSKAVSGGNIRAYRDKDFSFFERAIVQHSNVKHITRVYDLALVAHRKTGRDLVIVLVDAYNMSAEDVRYARERYGSFDIALKMSSYGNVTSSAEEAARSMDAEAMKFRDLLKRLGE